MPVHHYSKPDLSRCSSREMVIKGTYDAFEADLIKWMSDCVTHDVEGAEDLVCGNPGVNQFYTVVRNTPQMQIGNKRKIFADFKWGVLPDGHWRVTGVNFSISATRQAISTALQRSETEKQLDLEDLRQIKRRPDIRKMVFPAEDHEEKYLSHYVHDGKQTLQRCFKAVYNTAKEDAELPENPFENPLKDASSMRDAAIKTVATHLPGEGVGKKLSEAAEAGYATKEKFDAVVEDSAFKVGVLGAEHVAKKYVEGAGAPFIGFFELAVGGWLDAVISGQAGKVAKIRSHGYVYFTYGFLSAMVYADSAKPRTEAEKKYYRGGQNAVRKLVGGPLGQFNVQVALLHYAAENATGEWQFKLDPEEWIYPGDYIRKWSPQLLGRSMLTQLCKKEYLVE